MRKSNGINYPTWIKAAQEFCRAQYGRADLTCDFSRSFKFGFDLDETPNDAADWIASTAHIFLKSSNVIMTNNQNCGPTLNDEFLTRNNGATWDEWFSEAKAQCRIYWGYEELSDDHEDLFERGYEAGKTPSQTALSIGTRYNLTRIKNWLM